MRTAVEYSLWEKIGRGIAWTVAVIVGLSIIGSMLPKSDHADAYSAQRMCEEHFVKDQLLSPSSAKFSPDSETNTVSLGENRWTVTGYVDSQNAFGAMLRNRYSCTVRYLGDEKYRAESVDIGK
jgi:hypothetical protein